MATNNTVQYTITAKDQASQVFANVSKTAKGVGTGIVEAAVMAGAAMYKMSGTVKDGFGVLTGNFSKLGSLMGAIPGPIGVVGQAVGDALGVHAANSSVGVENWLAATATRGEEVVEVDGV